MSGLAGVVAATLVATGVALIGLAGVGLLRLPDAYARLNAAGKAAGLGVVCVLAGSAVAVDDGVVGDLEVALAIVLQLVTVPVGSFAIARAAHRSSTPYAPGTAHEESAPGSPGSPPEGDGG